MSSSIERRLDPLPPLTVFFGLVLAKGEDGMKSQSYIQCLKGLLSSRPNWVPRPLPAIEWCSPLPLGPRGDIWYSVNYNPSTDEVVETADSAQTMVLCTHSMLRTTRPSLNCLMGIKVKGLSRKWTDVFGAFSSEYSNSVLYKWKLEGTGTPDRFDFRWHECINLL
jgi:hypothetical protein